MTGWRIGFAAGNEQIIRAMTDLASHSTSNPTSVAQYAAVAALEGSQDEVQSMGRAFKERRDYLVQRLQAMQGIHFHPPEGAFYVFANIREAVNRAGLQTADGVGKSFAGGGAGCCCSWFSLWSKGPRSLLLRYLHAATGTSDGSDGTLYRENCLTGYPTAP